MGRRRGITGTNDTGKREHSLIFNFLVLLQTNKRRLPFGVRLLSHTWTLFARVSASYPSLPPPLLPSLPAPPSSLGGDSYLADLTDAEQLAVVDVLRSLSVYQPYSMQMNSRPPFVLLFLLPSFLSAVGVAMAGCGLVLFPTTSLPPLWPLHQPHCAYHPQRRKRSPP